jgi:RNA polymerase sigma factor (sigma-70 family)
VEASALRHQIAAPALAGRSPLLRLQGDEKLIAQVRRGHQGAFEALVQRYQPRLLAFCRHMLRSQEDAEDVLQEVFAAAYNALLADNRPINARPWLYRIARNRCLNHLRKPKASGQDSMDVFERDNGTTTAETVHRREEFRQIVVDVQDLPETQRTALLLREIDALSYDQISEAMDTTVPSVKSLLVRARVNLAEAAEARLLTCEEVRLELGHVAEGLGRTTPPVRRHLKSCERCRTFRSELRASSRALAAVFPLGPLILLKGGIAKLGFGAAGSTAAASGGAIAGGTGLAAGGAAGAAASAGAISTGVGALASKAVAGMAAAAIVTAGAVEVNRVSKRDPAPAPVTAAAPQPVAPVAPAPAPDPRPVAPATQAATPAPEPEPKPSATSEPAPTPEPQPAPAPEPPPAEPDPAAVAPPAVPAPLPVQEDESTATLPSQPTDELDLGSDVGAGEPAPAQPAPPAGEPAPRGAPPPLPRG